MLGTKGLAICCGTIAVSLCRQAYPATFRFSPQSSFAGFVASRYCCAVLGDELRKARDRAGLTQEQLGFEAGVHRTYESMLERDLKSPTLDVLFRLCKALSVRPSWLIARIEKG